MPKHKLYQMMLNCEDWRSSTTVSELTAAARGCFISLLAAAWLTDDCTLPKDDSRLRRLAQADSDAQWEEVAQELRPLFKSRGDRCYNPVQMEAFEKALHIYEVRSKAGKEGGKQQSKPPSKSRSKPGSPEKAHPPTTDNRQQTTESRHPTPDNNKGTTSRIGELIEELYPGQHDFTPDNHGSFDEYQAMLGCEDWKSNHKFYEWVWGNHRDEAQDFMDIVRNGSTEESRATKGCVEIIKPGGFLASQIKKAGIDIPDLKQLNKDYY